MRFFRGRRVRKVAEELNAEYRRRLEEVAARIPGAQVAMDDSASSVNNRGLELAERGRLDEALAAHREALDRYEYDDNPRGRGLSLTNIGRVLHMMGRDEEALEAFASGIEFSK